MEKLFNKSKSISLFYLPLVLSTLITSCQTDRNTVIYGKVVDQNQQPVDSIMILVTGSKSFHAIPLAQTLSGKNGEYQFNIDVEKNYVILNVGIPTFSIDNPKFYTQYRVIKTFRNGQSVGSCCFTDIGEKTRWDFGLAPK